MRGLHATEPDPLEPLDPLDPELPELPELPDPLELLDPLLLLMGERSLLSFSLALSPSPDDGVLVEVGMINKVG